MPKLLAKSFFVSDTVKVARELLGKTIVRKIGNKEIRATIIETEAYDGFKDRASHASRGMTIRNSIMFGRPNVWYIYFTYGMHWMLNVVTRESGYPAAVLIRAILLRDGARINGPAKLTKFLHINGEINGKNLSKNSGLWIENGKNISDDFVRASGRVGVSFAGKYWSQRKWRFTADV